MTQQETDTTDRLKVGDWSQHPTQVQADRRAEVYERAGFRVVQSDRGSGLYRYRVEIVGQMGEQP